MKIEIEIPEEQINNLMHGHGGSVSSWLHEVKGRWNGKEGIRVVYDREEDEEGDGNGSMRISRKQVAAGLKLMAESSTYQFAQFLDENDDDITFDTALQYIIFGKLVYA